MIMKVIYTRMTKMIIIVARDLQMDGNKSIEMTGDLEETQVYK